MDSYVDFFDRVQKKLEKIVELKISKLEDNDKVRIVLIDSKSYFILHEKCIDEINISLYEVTTNKLYEKDITDLSDLIEEIKKYREEYSDKKKLEMKKDFEDKQQKQIDEQVASLETEKKIFEKNAEEKKKKLEMEKAKLERQKEDLETEKKKMEKQKEDLDKEKDKLIKIIEAEKKELGQHQNDLEFKNRNMIKIKKVNKVDNFLQIMDSRMKLNWKEVSVEQFVEYFSERPHLIGNQKMTKPPGQLGELIIDVPNSTNKILLMDYVSHAYLIYLRKVDITANIGFNHGGYSNDVYSVNMRSWDYDTIGYLIRLFQKIPEYKTTAEFKEKHERLTGEKYIHRMGDFIYVHPDSTTKVNIIKDAESQATFMNIFTDYLFNSWKKSEKKWFIRKQVKKNDLIEIELGFLNNDFRICLQEKAKDVPSYYVNRKCLEITVTENNVEIGKNNYEMTQVLNINFSKMFEKWMIVLES